MQEEWRRGESDADAVVGAARFVWSAARGGCRHACSIFGVGGEIKEVGDGAAAWGAAAESNRGGLVAATSFGLLRNNHRRRTLLCEASSALMAIAVGRRRAAPQNREPVWQVRLPLVVAAEGDAALDRLPARLEFPWRHERPVAHGQHLFPRHPPMTGASLDPLVTDGRHRQLAVERGVRGRWLVDQRDGATKQCLPAWRWRVLTAVAHSSPRVVSPPSRGGSATRCRWAKRQTWPPASTQSSRPVSPTAGTPAVWRGRSRHSAPFGASGGTLRSLLNRRVSKRWPR